MVVVTILPQLLLCFASLLAAGALHYQKRYNRLHRSIYGLSYDTQWFILIYHSLSLYCSLNYKLNPVVVRQLTRRYPLFYNNWHDIPIFTPALFIDDLLIIYFTCGIIRQLYCYGSTGHIHQGVSSLAMTLTIFLVGIMGIMTFWFGWWFGVRQNRDSGLLGVFWLDHVNYVWFVAQLMHSWMLWPQICINWMGKCCRGLSSRFVIVSLISILLKILGQYIYNSSNGTSEFFQKPFNTSPQFVNYMELLALLVIILQAQYFYLNNKPYLPKRHSKGFPTPLPMV